MKKVNNGLTSYYFTDDKSAAIVTLALEMKDKVIKDKLEKAVNNALGIHRHYAVSLTEKDNNIYYVENNNYCHVFDGNMDGLKLIKETDGYLFAFSTVDSKIYFSIFRMLADGDSFLAFIRTVLYFYFQQLEQADTDWSKLIETQTEKYQNEINDVDPYTLEKVSNAEKVGSDIAKTDYFTAGTTDDDYICQKIELDWLKVNELASAWKIRPYVMVNVALNRAIKKVFNPTNPIAAYMVIDMRKCLGIFHSSYDCVVGVNVEQEDDDSKTFEEQCVACNKQLRRGLDLKKALTATRDEAELCAFLQRENMSIDRKRTLYKQLISKVEGHRGTYVMSFFPFFQENDVLKNYVEDMYAIAAGRLTGIVCEMVQVGDRTNLNVVYRSIYEPVISDMCKALNDCGLETKRKTTENVKISVEC